MIDSDIKDIFTDLADIMQPKPLKRLESLIVRLLSKVEELTKSREQWKEKYMALKQSQKDKD